MLNVRTYVYGMPRKRTVAEKSVHIVIPTGCFKLWGLRQYVRKLQLVVYAIWRIDDSLTSISSSICHTGCAEYFFLLALGSSTYIWHQYDTTHRLGWSKNLCKVKQYTESMRNNMTWINLWAGPKTPLNHYMQKSYRRTNDKALYEATDYDQVLRIKPYTPNEWIFSSRKEK